MEFYVITILAIIIFVACAVFVWYCKRERKLTEINSLQCQAKYWEKRREACKPSQEDVNLDDDYESAQKAYKEGKEAALEVIHLRQKARSLLRQLGEPAPPDDLDLHFLNKNEAIKAVEAIMKEYKYDVGTKITIITGRGKHSTHGAVLKPATEKFLESLGYRLGDGYKRASNNDGRIIVTIKWATEV